MEMPEQEAPVIFSQMSQMFPNIPHDVIQMHVQKYSSDVEKCTEMLNLQNGKYIELQLPTLNNCENLNTDNNLFQAPHLMLRSESVLDNNNDSSLLTNLPLLNSIEEEENIDFFLTRHTEQKYQVPINIAENVSTNFPRTNINFNEPLILNIEPDCDEMSHSWRPTMSADLLSSDLFVPSPMFESNRTNSAQILNLNVGLQNSSECSSNPNSLEKGRWSFSAPRMYDYPASPGGYIIKDVGSYLHYQKSQMNILRYEVIKAKIDLGDLRDCIEKLEMELKEKMQSKSVQDIIDLNKEIEQLRLDCQYLCTEIDHNVKDPVLLGEIDEKFYEKNESSLKNKETQNTNNPHCVNSDADCIATQTESSKWQCLKCTFANHPAISSCEMCQSPKPAPHSRPPLFTLTSSCYCHPKDKSLTIQS